MNVSWALLIHCAVAHFRVSELYEYCPEQFRDGNAFKLTRHGASRVHSEGICNPFASGKKHMLSFVTAIDGKCRKVLEQLALLSTAQQTFVLCRDMAETNSETISEMTYGAMTSTDYNFQEDFEPLFECGCSYKEPAQEDYRGYYGRGDK